LKELQEWIRFGFESEKDKVITAKNSKIEDLEKKIKSLNTEIGNSKNNLTQAEQKGILIVIGDDY